MSHNLPPSFPAGEFEAPKLSPEERCLQALLDLEKVQGFPHVFATNQFFTALTGTHAPDDLQTSLSPHDSRYLKDIDDGVTDTPIVAGVTVGFNCAPRLMNISFLTTNEGLKAYTREIEFIDNELRISHTMQLNDTQITALEMDARNIKNELIETQTELLKLGPLVEEEINGQRRFHIGDVAAVITESPFDSPRGLEGMVDLLTYMTGEAPFSTQISRFLEECSSQLLRRHGDILAPIIERLEVEGVTKADTYRILAEASTQLGTSFLEVKRLQETDHARIDQATELELDYGPEIRDKILRPDDETDKDIE